MSATPQLILAPTIHRAKQLEQEFKNPLAQSLTIGNFIKALYERYGTKRQINQQEVKYIVAGQLAKVRCTYFDYLSSQSDAVEEISNYFVALKRNDAAVSDFGYVKEKEAELQALFITYHEFLQEHHLVDQGDVEVEMLEVLQNNSEATKPFGEIFVADFESNNIHFTSSKIEAKILECLLENGAQPCPEQATSSTNTDFFQLLPSPFNQSDEVASALKIARKLLDSGTAADEIIIVTTSIDEYASLFESQLEQYGLKGYISKGVALKHYLPLFKQEMLIDENLLQAKNSYERIKLSTAQLESRLKTLGIEVTYEALLEELLEQSYVKSKSQEGVLLTEPNQLLSLQQIKHLIFMGTDMSHFPPKSSESFLVTQKQKQALLHGNSIYLSSKNHYIHMKDIAENLYIVTATYKGKTKLARSLLITEKCKDFDVSAYKAQHELLREQKRIANREIEPFLNALQVDEMTAFDGLDVGTFKVRSLSASQLNSYATCPRKYFMNRILGLKAPQEEDEGFDAMQKGTIMHRCFELFAKDVKAGKIELGSMVTEILQKEMQGIAQFAYREFLAGGEDSDPIEENINHQLYLQELQQGLDNRSEAQGPLQNFLNYVIENKSTLDGFKSSEFEMEFRMDENFDPVSNDSPYFMRGFIDRIDILEDEIRIVDYKSKKMDKKVDKEKLVQMQELQDMQLTLYILYAKREYGTEKIESYLQTFKSKYGSSEFAKAATYEVGKEDEYVYYDEAFEESLITKIAKIKSSIETGDFHYDDSDEDQCKWCEFKLMCNTN